MFQSLIGTLQTLSSRIEDTTKKMEFQSLIGTLQTIITSECDTRIYCFNPL